MYDTYGRFMDALDDFRKLNLGTGDARLEDILAAYGAFAEDEENELYVITAYDGALLTIDLEEGRAVFGYTSIEEMHRSLDTHKSLHYMHGKAYDMFKGMLSNPKLDGIFINDATKPCVYIPSEIVDATIRIADGIREKRINQGVKDI